MLKWTVQQKRHRAAAATFDELDEHDSVCPDSSSCHGSSRSNSGDCDGEEEQQQQVARVPDGSAASCCLIGESSAPTTESAACQRWAADHREASGPRLAAAKSCDADEDAAVDSSAASSGSFVRRPSMRQPRGRSARPLSLNLETFYACDRAAIPQKAKALLGIDERPRTPIVAAAATAAVGQLDGLSMSPKALAVLGITAGEQQSQQVLQHRQRKSHRRSPAGSLLQQISEGSSVCDGPDANSSSHAAEWCGRTGSSSSSANAAAAAASGGMANGRTAVLAESAPAACNEVSSRNGSRRREGVDGLSPDGSAGSFRMYDGRVAATSAAALAGVVRDDADRNSVRVAAGSPLTSTCHLPPQQQRAEPLNEAVEVVAARPKVARRRPLKHSRKESPSRSHNLPAAAASIVVEPDDDSSSSGGISCDGSVLDRSLQAQRGGRCGSCTPDSGVGGVQRSSCGVASAETDSPSDYDDDDDDAVAAWRQPHPLPPCVGSCACAERRVMPPTTTTLPAATLRVAANGPLPVARSAPPAPPVASPAAGTRSDFVDVDVRARPLPLARLPSAAAVACRSHGAPGDRRPRATRGDGRLTPESFGSTSDVSRRGYLLPPLSQHMLQPQQQLRTVAGAPSPVCGGRISPSLGLRHAHSDPMSSSTRTARDVLQAYTHEPESARWAAVKTAGSSLHVSGSGGRSEQGGRHNHHHYQQQQQHDRAAAERQAALAAYQKTVHVYC